VRPILAAAAAGLLLAACEREAVQSSAPGANAAAPAPAPGPATRPASAGFPALTGRVVDQAALLTPAQEADLAAVLEALEHRTGDQLVVATVASLGGRAIDDYGRALARHWALGQRGRDNGVLITVAPAERKVRIDIGYGLERILPNARAQEIIDRDLLPHFRESRWHEGLRAGTGSIVETLIAREAEPRGRAR
jgi:uncharacterized protein